MRAFTLLFRDSAAARMMDALLGLGGGEISKSDLAKAAGISRDSVYRILPEWESLGLVRMTRRIGVTKLYGLSQDHPSVAAMRTIDGLFNGPREFVRKTKPRRAGAPAPSLGKRETPVHEAPPASPANRLQEMLKRGVISEKTYHELVKKFR